MDADAMSSPSPTRQLLSREERQASILRAAARAFGRQGFAATSMDDVAAEAGITRLIVYRHFGSKEELYRAVLDQVRQRLSAEFQAAVEHPDPATFPFRSLIDVARVDPDAIRLLLVHAAREPQFADYAHDAHQRALALAESMVGDSIADATMRDWATRAMVGYIFDSLVSWLDVGAPERDDEFVERASKGAVAIFSVLTGIDVEARAEDE
jgi:AcrR family transcriptional regulator